MSKLFYRFRSIESLIGEYQELETQSIYFAHPKQLNDPMEGYRDIYWNGDLIVWKNLFRHYLLCLERFCSLLMIAGETHPLSEDEIPVFLSDTDLPTPAYKALFSEMVSTFLENQKLIALIKGVSERSSPVRRDELFFYLRAVHPIALEAIYKTYAKHGLSQYTESNDLSADQILNQLLESGWFEVLEQSLKENDNLSDISRAIFSVQKNTLAQLDIIDFCNRENDSNCKNRDLVVFEFPEKYISKLEQLVYPEWYVACFMSDFSNSSVWGHYGDNHSGVCLIFRPEVQGDEFVLNLNTLNGWGSSGASYGVVGHKFV